MTQEELIERKAKLTNDISDLIIQFHEETNTQVVRFNVEKLQVSTIMPPTYFFEPIIEM